MLLGAGLRGIEDELELEAPLTEDLSAMTEEEARAAGYRMLPGDLHEAIELFEKSELMREVLGEEMHRFIVENKREEWRSYRSQVTQWEIERFFPIL